MREIHDQEVDITGDANGRSTVDLLRSIATDSAELVRKEMELGRQEIVEAVTARLKAVGAGAVGGVMALMALGFFGLAAAAALDGVLAAWTARLVVAGGYLVLALAAFGFGAMRAKRPPLAPEETKRTVKEDVEWAKAQLKR